MSYRETSKETTKAPGRWGSTNIVEFTTYKCSHCGGYCVTRDRQSPPKVCGKCHR